LKRLSALAALALASALSCFYARLDTEALESKAGASATSTDAGADAAVEPKTYTTSLETPPIELEDGGTTRDPCVQTSAQVTEILTENCSRCHAPPASMGSFQSILDFPKLVTLRSNSVKDPVTGVPVRMLVPGDPDASRVYRRAAGNEMPPQNATPRPTLSDISVLRTWIQSCLPPTALDEAAAGDAGSSPEAQ
jgi:hypothetical protein